jgi:hypothetical protein
MVAQPMLPCAKIMGASGNVSTYSLYFLDRRYERRSVVKKYDACRASGAV